MRTEGCREWRESLGAYALGQLDEAERLALEAHLDGCRDCRAEYADLESVARSMALADPAHFAAPEQPPPALGDRIVATIEQERRSARRSRRLRFGFAFGGAATALAAVVLALVLLVGSGEPDASQRVAFANLPPGLEISATLHPRAYGTEVEMYVEGAPSGALCQVELRGSGGVRASAGTFRYRYGEHSAVLSSALDIARTRSIVVRVGNRAFSAPVS